MVEKKLTCFDLLYNERGERLEKLGEITLNLEYWDCDCDVDYIHSINKAHCDKCNAFEEDSPNSREDEVKKYFGRIKVY